MKVHEFDPVIYPYMLWVVVDKTPNELPDMFNEYTGKPIEFIDRDTGNLEAFTMPVINKKSKAYGVIIFLRSKRSMTFELIAHEASHAAKYMFEHIGADIKDHEPFEFAVGWIAGCCEKVKKNKA